MVAHTSEYSNNKNNNIDLYTKMGELYDMYDIVKTKVVMEQAQYVL